MSRILRRRDGTMRVLAAVAGAMAFTAMAMPGGIPAVSAAAISPGHGARQLILPGAHVTKHPKSLAAAESVSRGGGVPAGEEIVTATSDTNGYHLFAASAGDHWRWHALATLQPGGYSDETWIGEQCLTGDGRYVVAVVAPWSAQNSAAGIAAGGFGYAINAHTGAVRPLATGLLLAYFNPGCGSGSWVALSRYTSADQSATQILTVNAATGTATATPVIHNQVTSAIPVDGALYAAEGHPLVRIGPDGIMRTVSRHRGPVFSLVPNAVGGVDYLAEETARGTDPATGVYRLSGGRVRRIAAGMLRSVALLPGLGGHDTVLGGPPTVDVSSMGAMAVAPHGPGREVRVTGIGGRQAGGGMLPAPAAPVKALPPSAGTPPSGGGDVGATCAVPRNDPAYQVPQPSAQETDWALNLAGQGVLPVRPDSYANLHTGSYDPSSDFPLPAPFGAGSGIPAQILEGIFAQESNWNQASPHAPAGLSGNPYIADYYGIFSPDNSTGNIDFALADCGYGLGQITDGMRLPSPGDQPTALQKRVAVDYAENAAAAAQTLADKWNTLASLGITVGDNNPLEIEDWYFAIWAYNSGINPQSSTGGGSCVPSPDCTDTDGNWGLGWTNNPANPTYDPQRHPFLHDDNGNLTYGDAASPQGWPYQEKVFGWIESGQYESDGVTLKYSPTYNYSDGTGFFLDLPSVYAFCDSSDSCSPGSAQPCGYSSPNDPLQWHCWWHNAATFCPGTCHDGSWNYHGTDSEPTWTAPDPFPSICDPPAAGALIVDDSSTETNLAGCATRYADAAMTWYPDTDPGGGPFGDVDLHQLGTGYGGRTMFTHLEPPGNAQWGGTMTWTPNNLIPSAYRYDIEVFVPTLGAAGIFTYNVDNGLGQTLASVPVNQNDYGNQWVSIGTYELSPGASVDTTNVVSGGDGVTDVAFDAIAFLPMTTWTEDEARNNLLSTLTGTVSGPDSGAPTWGVSADVFQPDGTITTESMDTAKIIQTGTDSYLAVYTWNSTVKLASSADLLGWDYVTDLDPNASQPYIAREPNGSFMVADEKLDAAGSHVHFLHYADLSSLESGQSDWEASPPGLRFFSNCNEGTPDIHGISTDGSTINFGFHYNSNCAPNGDGLDREAYGTLSYPSGAMTAVEDQARDTAVSDICYVVDNQPSCYNGKHGGRDDIFWHGWRFSLQEAQDTSDTSQYANWQYVLYDYSDQTAYPVILPAVVDAPCHGNPKLTLLTDTVGQPELLVAGFKFGECPGAGAPGREFVYTVEVTGNP